MDRTDDKLVSMNDFQAFLNKYGIQTTEDERFAFFG